MNDSGVARWQEGNASADTGDIILGAEVGLAIIILEKSLCIWGIKAVVIWVG